MATLPLASVRILSLALNLPGPAALMRCRALGAQCRKAEPPSGDPMRHYNPAAYAELHQGVDVFVADLKSPEGRQAIDDELARTDVLLTSFRPSALSKLGLSWEALHARHPRLSQVAIVGGPGDQAEVPGHDLTYLAEHDLVTGTGLPATLFADMGGALMATQAVLQAALLRGSDGQHFEVALSDAAAWLALPRRWGLTQPTGAVGGAHAGYRVYPCQDGRVAVAALEPHFAQRLCEAAGVPGSDAFDRATHDAIATFFQAATCDELDRLARERDIPLHALRD
ncbi:CoA transferase [Ramlibacter algicola]|uniref:CoA transferase n=1 Tax=Ramlibacter algicola TaxID=2795217 RepID=A0A934US80_9BURK|nr:CaiB/BaiF CoA-transferase family protein [Ramlibacter algicola]MBK0393277.1 CoA transferase [Ramlibacter algicola]